MTDRETGDPLDDEHSGGTVSAAETVRDGERTFVECLIRDQREANAQLVSVTLRAQELTDDAIAAQMRAEAITNELRESEQRYRTLFELCPAAVYSCDRDGVIQQFNRHAADLWGREPVLSAGEQFCGSSKLFRPDGSFVPHAQCPMVDVLSGRFTEVRDTEMVIERPDGSRIIVVVNIRPLKNLRGEITAAVNCFYDITERKQAEQARARIAAIVDSSDEAIVSKSLDGVIESWNKGAERLFGYSAQEAIGQSMTMLIPSDRPNEEPEILRKLRRGEHVSQFETVRVHKDGSLLELAVSISPIADGAGRITGASKIAHDIGERKQAERALHKLAEFRETFIAILGHDLRTPLFAIDMAAATLIQRGDLDPRDAATAGRIIRSSQRMTRMVHQMLDLTRARLGGGLPIELEPTDLGDVCRSVVEEFGETIQVACVGDLTGSWDKDRLEEVISNLAGNAIQYATVRTPVIITARADGTDVVVEICNQGDPIPADILPFIFEPFRRARQPEKSTTGNLGLGLYIAHQIVIAHNGTLDAHCSDGTTTFVMRLPRRSVELHAGNDAAAHTNKLTSARPFADGLQATGGTKSPSVPATRPSRILIVEDSEDVRNVFRDLLERRGHEVTVAVSGPDGIAKILELRPDVALVDLGLPEIDGYEVARRIRAEPGGDKLYLVAVTGDAGPETRARTADAGFDLHLTKPLDINELSRVVSRSTQNQRS